MAVIAATELAFDYRQTFGSDVVIDMYCWRKHGHNESDEPAFTQPTLYKTISSMPPVSQAFADHLINDQVVTAAEVDAMCADYHQRLESAFELAKASESKESGLLAISTAKQQPPYDFRGFDTRISHEALKHIAVSLTQFPFRLQRKS